MSGLASCSVRHLAADTFFSDVLHARFDIVSVDPRGVGASTPIRCGVPPFTPDYTFFPRTQQQFDAVVAHNRALAKSCLQQTGPLFLNADTVSVAHDHESFGVQLGAQYAQLYPNRTRAMVLDAALEHNRSELQLTSEEIRSGEETFNRFAEWCDTTDDCVLRGKGVAAIYDKLVQDANQNPIPVDGALRPVTGDDIRINTPRLLTAKYPNAIVGDLSWAAFAEILRRAVAGDAQYCAFGPPGGPTDPLYARLASHCGDYVASIRTFADMQQRIEMARQIAPHLQGGTDFWLGGLCIGWPFKVANPQRTLNATHDPSLPYQWAFSLAGQARGSSVLTRVGDGHTSYYTSTCARDATDQFLLTKQSAAAPVCPA